jgi:biotin carboxyl carrier protein
MSKNRELFEITLNGESHEIEVSLPAGMTIKHIGKATKAGSFPIVSRPDAEPETKPGEYPILAPMPGSVVSVCKKVGDKVKMGETVVVLEAMKMYNNLHSPIDGVVKELPFTAGENVKKYDALAIITNE